MRTFSSFHYPPGGYCFTDSNGIKFEGDSVSDVALKLEEFRTVNGFPVGCPLAEVHEQLCERFPSMEVFTPAPVQDRELVVRVVAKAKEWLDGLAVKRRPALVSTQIANKRAERCLNCVHNLNWRLFCMPSQLASMAPIASVVSPFKPHPRLTGRACEIAGDDLSIAVHLDGPSIETDCECWRQVDVCPPSDTSQSNSGNK